MSRIGSRIAPGSAEFQANTAAMRALIAELDAWRAAVSEGGPEAARERHAARGKLLPRERLWRLIDPGSPFLELGQFAALGLHGGDVPGAGLITGIGRIEGRECMIIADEPTVGDGLRHPMTVKKHLRAQEIARENRLPCVSLLDPAANRPPHQAGLFPDRDHDGRIFYNQARLSAAGTPQIAVVMGPCLGAAAFSPAMADETIIVEGQGAVVLDGPAPGAVEPDDDDGRARRPGASRLARNDAHAIELARRAAAALPAPRRPDRTLSPARPPAWPAEDLPGLIPAAPGAPWDIREIIARLVDGSAFDAFRASCGPALVTGFAHIEGIPVGVLANNGLLCPESARKATQFVDLCSRRRVPLLFLQNIAGFAPAPPDATEGAAWDIARMAAAAAYATVPKVTVVIGDAFGPGADAMGGRACGPRFLFAWPNARLALTEGEQAAGLWCDAIITPLETRRVLALAFSATLNAPVPDAPSDLWGG